MEHWYPDGINEPRHYTDLKTIVKAPRILQEMSLMVIMVAAARPTPAYKHKFKKVLFSVSLLGAPPAGDSSLQNKFKNYFF